MAAALSTSRPIPIDPRISAIASGIAAVIPDAQCMVQLSGFRDSSIGFRLQQACEKALKSWMHAKGGMAPFTHDLVALMDRPLLLSVTASLLEQVNG